MVDDMVDKELEDQLREAGGKLLQLPSSTEEVLSLLDQIETCLSRVEQSPSKAMQDALHPSMKALVASALLGHANTDVKASVASCVSEITRITAPEAPYTDEQMKQIFQLIVSSFEMLGDTSSRSYQRRVSILETVAKVRSCVVMLDLECDGLILDMFQYFLKSIRDDHPANVFSSMETIMSLVLEESEEIPPELLYPLLTTVKKENKDVLSVAKKLGVKVLENCSSKLKPYLMQAVKSLGTSPKDYSKIVSSICQEAPDTTEHNDDSVSGEHLANERSLPEEVASDKPSQVSEMLKPEAASPVEVDMVSEKSATIATSNGDAQSLKDDTLVDIDSSEKKEGNSEPPKDESNNLESKPAISETDLDQPAKKKRGRPPKYAAFTSLTPEASDQSKSVTDGVTKDLASQKKNSSKEDDIALSGDHSVLPSGAEKEATPQVPSPAASEDESVKVASPAPSQTLPDGSHSKRGRPRKKKVIKNEDTDHYSASLPKEAVSSEKPESDAPVSTDASPQKEEPEKEVEEKRIRRASNKVQLNKEIEKASAASSDSEEKPLKKSAGKKADAKGTKDEASSAKGTKDEASSAKKQESSAKKQSERTKKGKSKSTPDKDLPGESSNKKTASSTKSTEKSASKSQKPAEETPMTKSKRKRTEKEETSEKKTPEEKEKPSGEESGEKLVGVRIRVWWPIDKTFYNGTVDSYNPSVKKSYTVLYDDGEKEELNLSRERWERIDGSDGGDAPGDSSHDDSSEKPLKKVKTSSGSGSKQAKTDSPAKKGKEASTSSKSKEETAKSTKKTKDTPKAEGTPKGGSTSESKSTPKASTKAKEETPKTSSKAKDGASKAKAETSKGTLKSSVKSKDKDATPTKSEEEAVKTKSKAKGTPQSGANNGTPSESAKTPEAESKSSKKRRKTNG